MLSGARRRRRRRRSSLIITRTTQRGTHIPRREDAEEAEERGLIKDLKRHARLAVAWVHSGTDTGLQSPGGP
jgi:hypothetical protein